MRTETKLVSAAALIAALSTPVIAETSVETSVPSSLETSNAVEAGDIKSVETFTDEQSLTASEEETMAAETGANMSTEVEATAENGSVPASLEDSRLAESGDLEANDGANMMISPMTDQMVAWGDDEAAEMRAAILANTMVKDALAAEGYDEEDVVAAYTRADGGLTLVVDG